ncbi:MAG: hypothetical protein AAGA80_17285 [Cyanobacteria bacterium P01_F01_bin.143]
MTEDEFQTTTIRILDKIEETLERLVTNQERMANEQEKLVIEQEKFNIRIETYQKSSQQVVNLGFGLILTSALAIIIPAVMNK